MRSVVPEGLPRADRPGCKSGGCCGRASGRVRRCARRARRRREAGRVDVRRRLPGLEAPSLAEPDLSAARRVASRPHIASRDGEIDLLVELAKLTERQRQVIVSRYVLGLSQAETAELLQIAPGTVAATAHQATGLLRERLLGGTK